MMNTVVFWEDGFPFVDTQPVTLEALQNGLGDHPDIEYVSASELSAALQAHPDLFLHPYGSAFPVEAWVRFTEYLARGGNWVNLGGSPVSRPAFPRNDAWCLEAEQRSYAKEIFIKQAYPVNVSANTCHHSPLHTTSVAGLGNRPRSAAKVAELLGALRIEKAWSLQVGFAEREYGASNCRPCRTGELRPLVQSEEDGRVVAAPVVIIDRLQENHCAGRWVLASCQTEIPFSGALIRTLCNIAVESPVQLVATPSLACYYPDERPTIHVDLHGGALEQYSIRMQCTGPEPESDAVVYSMIQLGSVEPRMSFPCPLPTAQPGLYKVEVSIIDSSNCVLASAITGFWIYDSALLRASSPVTINRDYFLRDGLVTPITGTTYMASDSHRNFLFEPNPAVWDQDFARMIEAGVNMVRTGFWRGWSQAMTDDYIVEEGVLRALSAFFLTVARYRVPVIFTFFSFFPEAWGGENPYLSEQALASQIAFVKTIAKRFSEATLVIWDLINEPSFSSPARAWKARPNYDASEQRAWQEWLANQGISDAEWRLRWGLTPNSSLGLPPLTEFGDPGIFEGAPHLRVLDYHRFVQDAFRQWATTLSDAIHSQEALPKLITVGQDEGGTNVRPNPHFFGPAVDFTSNHSWWQNDSLLWDSLITKTADRPNLLEETGVMFGERLEGRYQRSPEQARNLLEHKMALSFAGGCAGFIQWLWNTNVYLDSDNEAAIGLLRADGSEKPEMDAFRHIARFFSANAHRVVERQPEDFCIVIPHTNQRSVRDTATNATRRAVRTLEYHLGIPCRMVSEYQVADSAGASCILLPSPGVLSEECWQRLLEQVGEGAKLFVTGCINADEYSHPMQRLRPFGFLAQSTSVSRAEQVIGNGKTVGLTFVDSNAHIEKTLLTSCSPASKPKGNNELENEIFRFEFGKGLLYYCPLPVELAVAEEQTADVYRAVFGSGSPSPVGLLTRFVQFQDCQLWILVNESNIPQPFSRGALNISVAANRIALAFLEEETGHVLDAYIPR